MNFFARFFIAIKNGKNKHYKTLYLYFICHPATLRDDSPI